MQDPSLAAEFKTLARDALRLGARCLDLARIRLARATNEIKQRRQQGQSARGGQAQPGIGQRSHRQSGYALRDQHGVDQGQGQRYGHGYEPDFDSDDYGRHATDPGQDYGQRYGHGRQDFGREGRAGIGQGDRQREFGAGEFGHQSPYGSGIGGGPQRAHGGQRGRGPKNYGRTDARIGEDVSDRLAQDDLLDASAITVKVRNGFVTLQGTVGQRWLKRHAENLVADCSAVRDVENQLRVQPESQRASGVRRDQPGATPRQARSNDGNGGKPHRPGSSSPAPPGL